MSKITYVKIKNVIVKRVESEFTDHEGCKHCNVAYAPTGLESYSQIRNDLAKTSATCKQRKQTISIYSRRENKNDKCFKTHLEHVPVWKNKDGVFERVAAQKATHCEIWEVYNKEWQCCSRTLVLRTKVKRDMWVNEHGIKTYETYIMDNNNERVLLGISSK